MQPAACSLGMFLFSLLIANHKQAYWCIIQVFTLIKFEYVAQQALNSVKQTLFKPFRLSPSSVGGMISLAIQKTVHVCRHTKHTHEVQSKQRCAATYENHCFSA